MWPRIQPPPSRHCPSCPSRQYAQRAAGGDARHQHAVADVRSWRRRRPSPRRCRPPRGRGSGPSVTAGTSPFMMCRSVPQIVVVSTRTMASVEASSLGSGFDSHFLSPGPWKTRASIRPPMPRCGRYPKGYASAPCRPGMNVYPALGRTRVSADPERITRPETLTRFSLRSACPLSGQAPGFSRRTTDSEIGRPHDHGVVAAPTRTLGPARAAHLWLLCGWLWVPGARLPVGFDEPSVGESGGDCEVARDDRCGHDLRELWCRAVSTTIE